LVYAEKAIRRSRQIVAQIVEWRQTVLETENHALKDLVLDSVNLVGATCIGIKSQRRFADLQYDVTIIDEAGQIQIHNALVPMSASNKLIMLGDHKQIPPMVEEKMLEPLKEHEITTKLLEKSLFEDLYERFPDTNKSMLDTQFRMPSEIAKILSDWFYEGKYKSHPSKENITGELKYLSEKPFVIVDTFDDPYRYESSVISQGEGNKAHVNKLEADIIADIVSILYHSGYDMSKIGAIAALKAQVALIHRKMIERGIPKDLVSDIVATLDSYQGQERDIILYSFVRSSQRETDKTGVGFLTELRRLNVAMSRCKRTLVMVGDMTFLSTRDAIVNYRGEAIDLEQDWVKTERHFAQFIRHILQYVNDGAGERMNIATYRTRLQNWRRHARKEE
jgi:superfamily I DNA and/or RNA helicase